MKRFEGKKILITGGTSGIGLETAKIIANEGGQLIVTGFSKKRVEATKEILPKNSLVLQSDASDPKSIKMLLDGIKDEFGNLDAAFLNAGLAELANTEDIDEEHIDKMININFKGVALYFSQLKHMMNKNSSIAVTSSVGSYLGTPNAALYCACKAAVVTLARSFAQDFAPLEIRVNTLSPGFTKTNFYSSSGIQNDEVDQMSSFVENRVTLGRYATPKELAKGAVFLLSNVSSYMTGSELISDGGLTLR